MVVLLIGEIFKPLEKKLTYVVDVFNSIYRVDEEVYLVYGEDRNRSVNVLTSDAVDFFQSRQEKPKTIEFINWMNRRIPILFSKRISEEVIVFDEATQSVTIEADILSSAFYFLSCWQEYRSDIIDNRERFPATASLLHELNTLHLPVVNYYFDILATALEFLLGNKPEVRYGDAEFNVAVTHDIDQCRTGWREESFNQFHAGKWGQALKTLFQRIWQQDVWFNFDQLLQLGEELNIKATYFFIAEKKRWDKYPNADYDLSSRQMQSVLGTIRKAGHEVGIHGSIGTAFNVNKLRKEIEKFPDEVSGGRFHYLMLKIPDSFDVLEKSGLRYDASMGFAEKIGFRSGFCYPYRPFNFLEEQAYNFIEFPLMVMDRTLIRPDYMGLSPSNSIEIVKALISEIKKFHGFFVLLWHNNTMIGFKYGKWEGIFRAIIQGCIESGATIKPITTYIQDSYGKI